QWNSQNHGGAGTGNSFNTDFSLEKKRALLHADEAKRLFRFSFLRVEALAVVVHAENKLVLYNLQCRFHARGLRVPRHIRQRLLENPENRRGSFGIQIQRLLRQNQVAFDSCAFFELLPLPLKRGRQAQVVQRSRPQISSWSSPALDALSPSRPLLLHSAAALSCSPSSLISSSSCLRSAGSTRISSFTMDSTPAR